MTAVTALARMVRALISLGVLVMLLARMVLIAAAPSFSWESPERFELLALAVVFLLILIADALADIAHRLGPSPQSPTRAGGQ